MLQFLFFADPNSACTKLLRTFIVAVQPALHNIVFDRAQANMEIVASRTWPSPWNLFEAGQFAA
jgi:hypothetical protein